MMATAYATQTDLLTQEGDDTVYAAFDRNRDGTLDDAELQAMQDCLDNASETIDSYLCQRYDLPLPSAPVWAKRIAIDLALYFGSRSADALTVELRRRYDDAIALLVQASKGLVGLGLPTGQQPIAGEAGLVRDGQDILIQSDCRDFTRHTLRYF